RDIKPANIIVSTGLDGEDLVKVLDFGIAKTLPGVDRETRDMTQTGEVFGSPHYMSPEQCLGFMLDQRSDIYSFGCSMFEVLSGKPPFAGSNPIQLLVKHINEQPKPIPGKLVRTPKMKSLQAIAMMCLEKEQIDRFQSISEIVAELKRVTEGKKFSELGASKLKRSVAMSQMNLISLIVPTLVFIYWVNSLRLPQVSLGLSGEQVGAISTFIFCFVLVFCTWGILKNVSNCSKLARDGLATERTWWLAHSFFFTAGMPLSMLTLFLILISTPALVSFSVASGLGLLHWLDYVVVAAFLLFAIGVIVACICPFGPLFDFRSKKVRYSTVSRKLAAAFGVVVVAMTMLCPGQISNYAGAMSAVTGVLPAPLSSGLDRTLVNLALQFNPGDNYLLEVRTTVNSRRGYIDEAIADCSTLIARTARDDLKLPDRLRRRALLYAEKGDYELAVKDLSREIRVEPYWRAYRLRGIFLRNTGDLQSALADFDKAEELSSGDANVLIQKAYTLALTGDSIRAIEILDEIDKQSWTRTDTETSFLRGLVYQKCGLEPKARESFEQAASQKLEELYSGGSVARVARGLARLELGRTAEALSDLRVDLMISGVNLRYDLAFFPPEIQEKARVLIGPERP
ncbi:MAG: protein kinase, partial [Cyanobacteria bacterium HKST-UBA02]|nr:protein kinase [Cyanobacteria bacterium HKST-UBA02]